MSGRSSASRGSSPLTRGKLHELTDLVANGGLIPAHAGKTVFMIVVVATETAHPRSRGENGQGVTRALGVAGSSPLTRGKRPDSPVLAARRRLIPAHAGKTPNQRREAVGRPAHPRSRGENQAFDPTANGDDGSSPLTRGKRERVHALLIRDRLIPAHAGKTQWPTRQSQVGAAHPRSRGENDAVVRRLAVLPGSSPLTRGKQAD